ncbi:protein containing DUF1566 [Candidatus Magnetobacterium bavaricum]|uniref:Protein containing DUF1566 n=1 Tax=Candidatus Magnetobacterium bavaricum TaxID=29290 RepID=A0A0F3GRV7_9BACT|nr:protein containing DUF1566 [Candidatus Magnetobacterium bavaricum]
MNSGGTYGYTDWRLPNVNELESLVDSGMSLPALPSGHPFTNVQSNYYWSSTSYANYTSSAWIVSMFDGFVHAYGKSRNYYVWPVRSGQSGAFGNSAIWSTGQTITYAAGDDGALQKGVTWPDPRFTDNGNNTVTDNLDGLIWIKDAGTPTAGSCTGSSKTWQAALDYVACLNAANYLGYSDWRLPNRTEMRSMADYGRFVPSLPFSHPFTNVQSDYYWSSTSYGFIFCLPRIKLLIGYHYESSDVKENFYGMVRICNLSKPCAIN